MAIKLSFINNKGGSAKTTSLVNLAGAVSLAYPEKRILIIEGDGQGNASTSFGLDITELEYSMYDVFMGNCSPEDAIVNINDNIDIIPANMDMNFLEFDIMETYDKKQKETMYNLIMHLNDNDIDFSALTYEIFDELVPKSASPSNNYFNMLEGKLDKMDEMYDIILFDTPPELKAVTSSILAVTDKAIIPFEPDVYSLDGIRNILSRIVTIKKEFNTDLEVGGILASKVRIRTNLHTDIRKKVKQFCKDNDIRYFKSEIPSSIRFASATAYKALPATIANPTNVFSQSYYSLLDEMIKNRIIDWSVVNG